MALCSSGAEERRRRYDEPEIIEPIEGEMADPVPVAQTERERPNRRDDEDDAKEQQRGEEEAGRRQPLRGPPAPVSHRAGPAMQVLDGRHALPGRHYRTTLTSVRPSRRHRHALALQVP